MRPSFKLMTAGILTVAAACFAVACGAADLGPLPVNTSVAESLWIDQISRGREIVATALTDRPSISVAVAVDGSLVWSETTGWACVDPKVPATTQTRFRGYSVMKAVTGTLALELSEQGKLDLDTPIATYLDGLPPATGVVTTRQLLGNLAGIRHYNKGEWMDMAKQHCETARDAIPVFAGDPLAGDPGSMLYSSFGFVLASAVLESAGGRPFPELVAETVFAPAGMSSTTADTPGEYDDLSATPYEWRRRPRTLPDIDNSCKFGGGSLLTTAEDLARFGMALLQGRLLKQDSFEIFFQSQQTTSGEDTGYSLGWGVFDADRIGHSGGAPGGRAFLLVNRRHDIVVALMSNVEGERLTKTATELGEIFAGGKQ